MTSLIEIEAPYGYWWKGSSLQKNPTTPFSSHRTFRTLKKATTKIIGILNTKPDVDAVVLLEWRTKRGVRRIKESEWIRRMK